MQAKVFILSGDIQTGKTTALAKWCLGKANIKGILTPVVEGKRMFLDAGSKEMFPMEALENEMEVLKVGRFVFSRQAFERANAIIVNTTGTDWLVIDEIGPLELRKEGLYGAVATALQNQRYQAIVLVVREGLVERVIDCFHIQHPAIIAKTALALL